MPVATVLVLINGLLSVAFQLYSSLAQIKGDEPIPPWDELLQKNTTLQLEIDKELG